MFFDSSCGFFSLIFAKHYKMLNLIERAFSFMTQSLKVLKLAYYFLALQVFLVKLILPYAGLYNVNVWKFSAKVFKTFYFAYVRSHLEYAVVVWNYVVHINKIESIQKKIFSFLFVRFGYYKLIQFAPLLF